MHDAGILHKDLKPANLIPDDTGEHIVLIDFGISSDAGKNTFVVTETGMTPFYAAPEAMQGIFHKETDYYALGITVFELFTGFTPFQNPGLSPEEAARLASVSKIEFPENFTCRCPGKAPPLPECQRLASHLRQHQEIPFRLTALTAKPIPRRRIF